jgi:hypothetical protein
MARKSRVYINGENFGAARADIGDDPDNLTSTSHESI